tara:strand:+ start:167 stop:535 length:369 start_codon:yes stop_codon:yes gene_type:complete
MKDNFNLKNFLKENQSMERGNPYLRKSVEEGDIRSKIREMVLNELEEADEMYEAKKDKKDKEVEDVEVEDVEIEDVEIEEPISEVDPEDIMGHLKAAFDLADGEKLKTQIGNTITMYTKEMY